MVKILATAAGVISVGFMPRLPPLWLGVGGLLICSIVLWKFAAARTWRAVGPAAAFLIGASWGSVHGHLILADQLGSAFDGEDFLITGRVIGLPRADARGWRFEFRVSGGRSNGAAAIVPSKLLLSWYNSPALPIAEIAPGDIWRLQVRLKRPRGFVNPGGFDYQGWLLGRGIGATGYVRASPLNCRIGLQSGISVSRWRHRLRRQLDSGTGLSHRSLLKALAIGDRSELGRVEWDIFQRTGTSHLMAISGLHIGLVASLGYLLGRLAAAPLLLLCSPFRGVTRVAACLGAILSALVYSALAGFALPTQRALVMVAVANLALLCLRPVGAFRAWSLALLGVLLLAPLAAHSPGFWLSFCAVGVLLLVFSAARYRADAAVWPPWRTGAALAAGRQQNPLWQLRQFLLAQWTVTLGLFLPLLMLGMSASVISPLANVVAIPLVSWGVVPPLLLGLGLLQWWPAAGWVLIDWADACIALTVVFLEWCDQLPLPQGGPSFRPGIASLVLAALGVLALLLPKGLPHRWLGCVALLCLFFPRQGPSPPLKLTVLDVGQGLAVVAQASGRTLVFDTGPRYSERFDAGSGIIAPFLRREGVRTLDKLIVSHGDDDHSGGLAGLLPLVRIGELRVGELLWGEVLWSDESMLLSEASISGESLSGRSRVANVPLTPVDNRRCRAGQRWVWGEVSFLILSPPAEAAVGNSVESADSSDLYRGNNASCVLLIRYASQSVLLAGDIETSVERHLLQADALPEKISLLLAPHHGSQTSSSAAFVQRLQPRVVVFSAGFRSRYGHPHASVVQRYREAGSRIINTAEAGAVTFLWTNPGEPLIQRQRRLLKRYWFTENFDNKR